MIVVTETLPLSILLSYDASLKCPQDSEELCQLSDVIRESSSFSSLPAAVWPSQDPFWSPRGCQWQSELRSFFPLAEEREWFPVAFSSVKGNLIPRITRETSCVSLAHRGSDLPPLHQPVRRRGWNYLSHHNGPPLELG